MKILLILLIFVSFRLNAQSDAGARIAAMGTSGVALQDIWSANSNQAGLIAIKRPSIALSYQKLVSGQNISVQTAVFALPVKRQVWALSIKRYGFDAYHDQQVGLSYTRAFGPNLAAAMAVKYQQLSITNYGKSSSYAVDAGLRFQLNPAISLGTHIGNISADALKNELQYASQPLHIQFGMAYQNSKQVLLALAIAQTLNGNTDARLGLEYQMIPLIALRGGLSVNPMRQYAGIGLAAKSLKLDMALSSHQALGYATQFSLAYAF